LPRDTACSIPFKTPLRVSLAAEHWRHPNFRKRADSASVTSPNNVTQEHLHRFAEMLLTSQTNCGTAHRYSAQKPQAAG